MNDRAVPLLDSRTVPLGEAFDLLAAYRPPFGAFFERRGHGASGIGGQPFLFEGIADLLRVLRGARRLGPDVAPVAIGGMGFVPEGGPLRGLMIPRRAVRRDQGGQTWRLDAVDMESEDGDPPPFEPVVGGIAHEPFADIQLREIPSAHAYEEAVREVVARIRRGEMRKVVLARTIEVTAERELDPRLRAGRLRAVDPDAYTFAVPADHGVLVGVSPELLVSRRGHEVRSNPLAGCAPRSGDPV
jgi:isochorismate synthase